MEPTEKSTKQPAKNSKRSEEKRPSANQEGLQRRKEAIWAAASRGL